MKRRDGASGRGQPEYTEFDFTEPSVFHLDEGVPVWADFRHARIAEAQNRDSDVLGVLELRDWSAEVIKEVLGRDLQTGDQIRFNEVALFTMDTQDHQDQWFVLGQEEHQQGIFRSVVFRKFNLRRSDRRN